MSDAAYVGGYDSRSNATEFERLTFIIAQRLARVRTATLVQVVACTNSGGVSAVGTVDVTPMVAQIDGQGRATPHGTIYALPYVRIQGGANAVIIDPQVGDIGVAVFCHTDISQVKATKAPGNPGSRRRFGWSDGVYIGGLLNGVPTSYVQFDASGNITVLSPGTITLHAPTVAVQGDLTVSGTTTGTGDGTFDGTDVHTHRHSGVTTGSGDTGAPV